MHQSSGPFRGRGGRRLPPGGPQGHNFPRQDIDAVMNDVERGEEGELKPDMAWGQGIAGWGERQEATGDAQERPETRTREPMPPQSAAFAATRTEQPRPSRPTEEQERRLQQAQWSSSIFRNTIEQGLRREPTSMPSTEGGRDTRPQDASSGDAELVGRVREAGLEISYRYDDEIPFDARTVIEDLLFQLTQRSNEVTHLQRKADSLQKRSRVRKREESEERECPPVKRISKTLMSLSNLETFLTLLQRSSSIFKQLFKNGKFYLKHT